MHKNWWLSSISFCIFTLIFINITFIIFSRSAICIWSLKFSHISFAPRFALNCSKQISLHRSFIDGFIGWSTPHKTILPDFNNNFKPWVTISFLTYNQIFKILETEWDENEENEQKRNAFSRSTRRDETRKAKPLSQWPQKANYNRGTINDVVRKK